MKPAHRSACIPLALALCASCTSTAGGRELPSRSEAPRPAEDAEASSWGGGGVLYGRDGEPVATSDPVQEGGLLAREAADAAARATGGGRAVGVDEGGRMYILELYQKVIEERDALTLEVAALRSEVERARQALAGAEVRISELETRCTAADKERDALRSENVELAGRLTTAQIRRLQAEKMLLELRIAQQRALEASPADEPAREPAVKP